MKKKILIVALLILSMGMQGFAQTTTISDIRQNVAAFSSAMAESLPFNSTLGLNWSDAYIGKLFPSAIPHFGVGLSLGFTSLDLPAFSDLMSAFGADGINDMPFNMDRMILPAYTLEARIGGFFLPFDMGFKFGYLPEVNFPMADSLNIHYMLVGFDVRYALMEGNVILPKISLGLGFNYLEGGIGASVGSDIEINPGSGGNFTIHAPKVGLRWEAYTFDLRAQISKSFLIITPYLGFGATYGWSTAGYEIETTISGNTAAANGLEERTSRGLSSMVEQSGQFAFRTFGGLSINLAVIKLDFSGMYNFSDNNFGASFGFRFQL